MKAGRLRNVPIAVQKFKNIPVYECSGKCIKSLFKEYQDALPEEKCSIVFATFRDIVELLTMCGDSKSGLYTYYIKLRHGKNNFDHILDRIGQMDLNGRFFHRHYWFYQITEEIMAQSLLIIDMGIWKTSPQKIRYGLVTLLHVCVGW